MCINGKIIHIETVPGMGLGENIGEWWGQGEFKYDIFDILQELCQCHNVPPPSITVKK
jgi:hypothetical protein